MHIIEINISGQKQTITTPCKIVAGSAGLYGVKITYDEQWNDAPYRLIRFDGCEEIKREDTGGVVEIPHECIKKPCYLNIGVLGLDGNGEIRITTHTEPKSSIEVYPSTWSNGDEPDEETQKTPSIYEDVKKEVNGLSTEVNKLSKKVNEFENITIDSELSEESKNPVQNSVVAKKVKQLSEEKVDKTQLTNAVNTALEEAKASGVFNGKDGKDYVLTDSDKQEIANLIGVSIPDGNEVAY